MTEEEEASTMWFSHTCMQAVSTMLNMNMSILTTGVSVPSSQSCPRCKLQAVFSTEEEFRAHTQKVHHRVETNEEREGRIQKARWTHLKPDQRIRETILNEKAEELILLHEGDVHYNIIVHKSHNAYKSVNSLKEHIEEDHSVKRTIFGDSNDPQALKSWAQVTKVSRPGFRVAHNESNHNIFTNTKIASPEESPIQKETSPDDNGWQQVGKRGRVIFNIPVQN